ncbi:MAG TPA: response regulator, partial [bacterium]|nr:response regulator [bacterium]
MKPTVILIVDDNPHISKLLTMNLEQSAFTILHAMDGEEGLAKIKTDKPDIVISDVMMPKLDGIAMCQQVRTGSDVPMVPFIFLTSMDSDITQKRGFRMGADQYLIKSEINRDTINGKVNEILKHIRKIEEIRSQNSDTFKSDLGELSFIETLQYLYLQKKTGTLTVVRQFYPEGKIIVRNGEILSATVGDDKDEKALLTISGWKRGTVQFLSDDVSAITPTVKTSTENIILESCRLTA